MKIDRIKIMMDCLVDLEKIKNCYIPVSPAWVLINTAQGHIRSLHHLETETQFDKETLGVKDE